MVCFSGVYRVGNLEVAQWLADRLRSIKNDDPFDRVFSELLRANEWINRVPFERRRHTFSVGAFIGSKPLFAFVSNYEKAAGAANSTAADLLSVTQMCPTNLHIFASGHQLSRPEKRRLANRVAKSPAPDRILSSLADVNREVSDRTGLVSPACFCAYLRNTGEGGGRPFNADNSTHALPVGLFGRYADMPLPDELKGARFHQFLFARADESDDYHATQLREKPDSAEAHNNYGIFLCFQKNDHEGAEKAYRRALALDPNSVSALANLGSLLTGQKRSAEAEGYYQHALEIEPGNESATLGYASLLLSRGEIDGARQMLSVAIVKNPTSAPLLLDRGFLVLRRQEDVQQAIEDFRSAREKGGDQEKVEVGYAIAMHLAGYPVGECIAQYRTAIALGPEHPTLKVNLAQLLFLKDNGREAQKLIREATSMDLDNEGRLEANFYLLCHVLPPDKCAVEAIKALVEEGSTTQWNVEPNISKVAACDPQKAGLLRDIANVLAGRKDVSWLDELVVTGLDRQSNGYLR